MIAKGGAARCRLFLWRIRLAKTWLTTRDLYARKDGKKMEKRRFQDTEFHPKTPD
jgi:hypothetical protein